MPPRPKPLRLWLKPAERGRDAVWRVKGPGLPRNGISTGCSEAEAAKAEEFLARAIEERVAADAATPLRRDPYAVKISEVLLPYYEAKRDTNSRPGQLDAIVDRLNEWWGDRSVGEISTRLCQEYIQMRGGRRQPGHELAYLRAAVNYAARERLIAYAVPVTVPPTGQPRTRWLTRDEVAHLVHAAWREPDGSNRRRKHIALFILIGFYTGTRCGAILNATFEPTAGHGWMDLQTGMFHRARDGEVQTSKRKPPIKMPPPLVAHLRRWRKRRPSAKYVIEWGGKPVGSIKKAFISVREAVGLDSDVTPHTLRHTCATHLMMNGADKWEAAGFLGMSLEMLENTYGHYHSEAHGSVHRALRSAPRSAPRASELRA